MVFIIARATGWREAAIWDLPLARALQYLHANMLLEGRATTWQYQFKSERRQFEQKLNALLTPQEYTEDYDDE